MRFTRRARLKGLIINRTEGEQVSINNGELLIEIVEIKGKFVKLAFQAHRDISIRRAEAQEQLTDGAVKDERDKTHEG